MKTAKELRKQFTNETGCGTSNFNGDGYYPDYTEWLENKIITSEKKEIKPTIEGENRQYNHICINCGIVFKNDLVYKSSRIRLCPECNVK